MSPEARTESDPEAILAQRMFDLRNLIGPTIEVTPEELETARMEMQREVDECQDPDDMLVNLTAEVLEDDEAVEASVRETKLLEAIHSQLVDEGLILNQPEL